MKKRLPVSTASTIHGVNIEESLGFVSSHVIAGTNLFSDIFAVFSDLFGGRSQTYKKQLTSIKNEAVEELMDEAIKVGGNAIVGMSIDLDEISGSGKSMFMITATGTAVRTDNSVLKLSPTRLNTNQIDFIELKELIFKEQVITAANGGNLKLSAEVMTEIIENNVFEVKEYILQFILSEIKYGNSEKNLKTLVKTYFSKMSKEMAADCLYSNLGKNKDLTNYILEIIKECYLFDYKKLTELLESGEVFKQILALEICCYDNSTYQMEDIGKHKELAKVIKINIDAVLEAYDVQKTFGTKKVWKCLCQKEVEQYTSYCPNCNFSGNHIINAQTSIDNRIQGLKIAFADSI